MSKPIILIFSAGYLPGYKAGGPIRSISNLVAVLGNELQFKIITADRDLGESTPYSGVKLDEWQQIGSASVFYASPSSLKLMNLRKIINSVEYDVSYINSFFSTNFAIKPLLLRCLKLIPQTPTILAPRGEFSPGALALKRFKKSWYISLARLCRYYENITWQASSAFEELDIQNVFQNVKISISVPIVVAPDLPNVIESKLYCSPNKVTGELDIVFLSRISPKKNLEGALTLLEGLQGKIRFNIYGPAEDKVYFEKCMKVAVKLKPAVEVVYQGEVPHNKVKEIFSNHHLFLFPTHGENYGHVILESLVAGCPVLLSDQTPWTKLCEAGVGWEFPLHMKEEFRKALQQCLDMDNSTFHIMSQQSADYGRKKSIDPLVIEQNLMMFKSVLKVPLI